LGAQQGAPALHESPTPPHGPGCGPGAAVVVVVGGGGPWIGLGVVVGAGVVVAAAAHCPAWQVSPAAQHAPLQITPLGQDVHWPEMHCCPAAQHWALQITPLGQDVHCPARQTSLALGQQWALQTTPLGQDAAPTRPLAARLARMLPPRARTTWRRERGVATKRAKASNSLPSML